VTWQLAFLPSFRGNRREQLAYIAREAGTATALKVGDQIMRVIALLPDNPKLGGRRGRVDGTRELVVAGTPFILVYRLNEAHTRIEILRLLHGSQLPEKPSP
jgi:toxin ParE1/3/4